MRRNPHGSNQTPGLHVADESIVATDGTVTDGPYQGDRRHGAKIVPLLGFGPRFPRAEVTRMTSMDVPADGLSAAQAFRACGQIPREH
jgi:hypothetical protein